MSNDPRETIKILGFLSCADNSILKLDLGHNFYVEALDAYKGLNLLEELGPINNRSFLKVELDRLNCIDQSSGSSKVFVVKNHFDNIKDAEKEVDSYLLPLFKIIRLFKEGEINIPILYYYSHDGPLRNVQRFSFYPQIYIASSSGKYSLDDGEALRLTNLIKSIEGHSTNMDLENNVLKIALNNYDLSYYSSSTTIALLDLSISLEALFNPSDSELRYRISRNAATLIGINEEESKIIYKFIKQIYSKRSKLVHTGIVGEAIRKEEITTLRFYTRRSIKNFYKYTLDNPLTNQTKQKQALLEILELSNFGASPVKYLPW